MQMLEYRAKAYYLPDGHTSGKGTILYSGHATIGQANTILTGFLAMPHVTGGHLERHVQGIGWVMADDDETEIERRRIDSDAIPPHTYR